MSPPPPSPLNQQPRHSISTPTSPSTAPYAPIHAVCAFGTNPRPRTQIEALPPTALHPFNCDDFVPRHSARPFMPVSSSPSAPAPAPAPQPHQYDPAIRHPVFFTTTLQRPPFGVGAGRAMSPVALGYVENSMPIWDRREGGHVKL